MCSVNVRHEVAPKSVLPVGAKCFADHHRSEIRTSNPDVDDVGNGFASVALPRAATHVFGKASHLIENLIDKGHHVLAVYFNGPIAPIPQRDVEHRAALAEIDTLAAKHSLDELRNLDLHGQLNK